MDLCFSSLRRIRARISAVCNARYGITECLSKQLYLVPYLSVCQVSYADVLHFE